MKQTIFESKSINHYGVEVITRLEENTTRFGTKTYAINVYHKCNNNDSEQYCGSIGSGYKTLNIAKRYLKEKCNLVF